MALEDLADAESRLRAALEDRHAEWVVSCVWIATALALVRTRDAEIKRLLSEVDSLKAEIRRYTAAAVLGHAA